MSGGDGNHSGSQPTVGTYLDEIPVTTIDGKTIPAKVIGTDSGGYQGGWVLVRKDLDPEDTAARFAKSYHVRTQALTYLHGFSTFPMPEGSKFLCDKAVVEVHYDPPRSVVGNDAKLSALTDHRQIEQLIVEIGNLR